MDELIEVNVTTADCQVCHKKKQTVHKTDDGRWLCWACVVTEGWRLKDKWQGKGRVR